MFKCKLTRFVKLGKEVLEFENSTLYQFIERFKVLFEKIFFAAMGIVFASQTQTLPVINDVAHDCAQQPEEESSEPGNPGSFQDIHKKVKDLYPRNFEGALLTINNKLSNHFRVSHTMTLSPITPSGYKFGAFYKGSTMIGCEERYPSLGCTLMPNGNQTMTFMHTMGCRYRIKFAAQVSENDYKTSNTALEYRSDNCTLSLSLDNPNLLELKGTLALHFLQTISSGLALGVEIACLRDKGQRTILSGAGRYSTGVFTVSSTLGEGGFHVCCHRKASEQLDLGAELEINLQTRESQGTLVYQLNVPRAHFIFRGMIDSERTVSAVFEKNLSSVYKSSLLISGALNHKKGHFRVGVGLNIG